MSRKHQVSIALTALAAGLTLHSPGVVRAEPSEWPVAQVDSYLQAAMQSRNVPGLSVAVARGRLIILERSYGLANVELGAPTSPRSIFEIGTASKQFTAAAIMLLVEQGKIRLDDPILTIMPELPEQWGPVSIRHLLTHTSGIVNYTSVPGFFGARASSASPAVILASVANVPLQFQPGEKFSTSSTDYLVLGRIIEKVSGMSYSRFLTERFFQPLSMGATRVNDRALIVKERVSGYTTDQSGNLRNVEKVHPSRLFASGAILSSAGDLTRWTAALASGFLLKPSSVAQMWTPAKLRDGTETQYGFGWYVHTSAQGTIIEHGGGAAGFRAQIVRYPKTGMTVVLFANSETANPYSLADGVHQIVTGQVVRAQ
jgi:D-alanyl-D-alanine carboxypeptidase